MTESALDAALDEMADVRPDEHPEPADHGPRAQLVDVRTTDLIPDPDNPREDVGDIVDLAASMAAAGLLQPIIARRDVNSGRLVVVAGHRRLAAAQRLGWAHVPTIIRRDMRPDRVLAAMLIENGQRANLDPIEEARALHRLLIQHEISSHAELARLVGRNQPYVSARLALMDLTPAEQEEVRVGHMKLIEATHRGRINSGKVRKEGQTKGWHLAPAHPLAAQVKARCVRLGHVRGRTVGGIGCGECWEAIEHVRSEGWFHLYRVTTLRAAAAVERAREAAEERAGVSA